MKIIGIFLILSLTITPVFAETVEVSSLITAETGKAIFWQEVDITFWQTVPFATFWGYFLERQLSSLISPGTAVHWEVILPFTVLISAGNAYLHAKREMSEKIKE